MSYRGGLSARNAGRPGNSYELQTLQPGRAPGRPVYRQQSQPQPQPQNNTRIYGFSCCNLIREGGNNQPSRSSRRPTRRASNSSPIPDWNDYPFQDRPENLPTLPLELTRHNERRQERRMRDFQHGITIGRVQEAQSQQMFDDSYDNRLRDVQHGISLGRQWQDEQYAQAHMHAVNAANALQPPQPTYQPPGQSQLPPGVYYYDPHGHSHQPIGQQPGGPQHPPGVFHSHSHGQAADKSGKKPSEPDPLEPKPSEVRREPWDMFGPGKHNHGPAKCDQCGKRHRNPDFGNNEEATWSQANKHFFDGLGMGNLFDQSQTPPPEAGPSRPHASGGSNSGSVRGGASSFVNNPGLRGGRPASSAGPSRGESPAFVSNPGLRGGRRGSNAGSSRGGSPGFVNNPGLRGGRPSLSGGPARGGSSFLNNPSMRGGPTGMSSGASRGGPYMSGGLGYLPSTSGQQQPGSPYAVISGPFVPRPRSGYAETVSSTSSGHSFRGGGAVARRGGW